MHIISCNRCGVLLDKDKLMFPSIYKADGTVDPEKSDWDGYQYYSVTKCPVCSGDIVDDMEEVAYV